MGTVAGAAQAGYPGQPALWAAGRASSCFPFTFRARTGKCCVLACPSAPKAPVRGRNCITAGPSGVRFVTIRG
ncbi:uncharacterized protein AruCF_0314 [Achromobacter ruhlandii]|nr:uncharacterized protein AruCF_0314 [Achromobacter ruhlandii]